jgi:D-alanyl-D-alanine dipeptidase
VVKTVICKYAKGLIEMTKKNKIISYVVITVLVLIAIIMSAKLYFIIDRQNDELKEYNSQNETHQPAITAPTSPPMQTTPIENPPETTTIEIETQATEPVTLPKENLDIPTLPDGFVYITDVIPNLIIDIRYHSSNNFIGKRVDNYLAPVAISNYEAANALKIANDILNEQGYAIKIFDAYRPLSAEEHFMRWVSDESDVFTKELFYPNVAKNQLITEGYIAKGTSHTWGSAIDLTLVCIVAGEELDMGTDFDFFDPASHHGSLLITDVQANNRLNLRNAMEQAGFRAYSKEWWHYTLINDPLRGIHFDFPVE